MSLTTWLPHAPRDIFLEELYKIGEDDSFGDKIAYNRGAWINADDLRMIKIFKDDSDKKPIDTVETKKWGVGEHGY